MVLVCGLSGGSWSECSTKCSPGEQKRRRTRNNKPNPGGFSCDGEEVDRKSFSRATRPITSHLSTCLSLTLLSAFNLFNNSVCLLTLKLW